MMATSELPALAYRLSNEAKRLAQSVVNDGTLRPSYALRAAKLERELVELGAVVDAAIDAGEAVDDDAQLWVSDGILDARFVQSAHGTMSLRLARYVTSR